ncbi:MULTISPECIES: universal stress protein [Streptomyces]|uniref:universal stress protein n=1 Tax=Streptomyces TaxID=1883 RepID=UPI001CB94084|nr:MULTISPECIES: universal stress protein [unclassified Streptomyces]
MHAAQATGEQEASVVIRAASARAAEHAPAVRLSSAVSPGETASALVGKGRNALALVLCPRGHGDLAGMPLGSVSLAVAARADGPVVVVRGTAEHRGARFGIVVVGVEDGEGSGTAVDSALRDPRAMLTARSRGPPAPAGPGARRRAAPRRPEVPGGRREPAVGRATGAPGPV